MLLNDILINWITIQNNNFDIVLNIFSQLHVMFYSSLFNFLCEKAEHFGKKLSLQKCKEI